MEQLNTDSLPVVDEQQHFAGTVERAKLTASLILAVTDKLEGR
jgi:CBS-domain-containing membrane protein